ncbi:reverse transcriptase domain-containing protein [Afifella aestuarii]|uniref:reverse transcriptase domain-containing protein n=1 Tax=Afifella aestuarii TaxID=1909496 RepID=UPI00196A4D25|nr:reverse transcriptase domain-containing protein [Afifella aestuarii]
MALRDGPMRPEDLFLRVTEPATLDQAWARVRANGGCAGGDGETLAAFSRAAARRILSLSKQLREGSYRPRALRIVEIAKKRGGTRPLAIPSIVDRVAQTACAQELTPLLDPMFEDDSFAYRPGRSVAMAVRRIGSLRRKGFVHVVEADIVRCFERIPQAPLLQRLEEALAGRSGAERVSDLVAHWLEHAGASLSTPGTGLPQGSPLSPLLANLYLDSVDEELATGGARLIRFADDFVILCRRRGSARIGARAGGARSPRPGNAWRRQPRRRFRSGL